MEPEFPSEDFLCFCSLGGGGGGGGRYLSVSCFLQGALAWFRVISRNLGYCSRM